MLFSFVVLGPTFCAALNDCRQSLTLIKDLSVPRGKTLENYDVYGRKECLRVRPYLS